MAKKEKNPEVMPAPVEEAVTKTPEAEAEEQKPKQPKASKKILKAESPFHIREAYKALRTNVLFSLPDSGCKKLIVTSSYAHEGKSINCLNLALSFGENGAKVLLIDCDLRRPNVARLLGKRPESGLSNVLIGLNTVEEVITPSEYPNLDVIFSGDIPPNPLELLGSDNFVKLIEKLEQEYDYIFLDSPPVTVVSDAVVLSRCVTGVILLVRSGRTDRDAVANAISQLEFAGAKILGTILNDTVPAGMKYKYRKNRYSYGYGRYYKRYYGRYYDRYYGYKTHKKSTEDSRKKGKTAEKK